MSAFIALLLMLVVLTIVAISNLLDEPAILVAGAGTSSEQW
jgi:hypothetical protein